MGTRHRQEVITKDGEMRIQQYGQWDGYPDGQGVEILEYLRNGDLEKYQKNLDSIPLINEDEAKFISSNEDWARVFPYLSRDCGSKIHQMIEDGVVRFVQHAPIEECERWCEGFYTIDFENDLFISEYRGNVVEVKISNLPTNEEYLKMFEELNN